MSAVCAFTDTVVEQDAEGFWWFRCANCDYEFRAEMISIAQEWRDGHCGLGPYGRPPGEAS